MPITERLDEYGKGAWIALTVLSFWVCWPLGLASLIFLCGSGRLRAWKHEARARWHEAAANGSRSCWGGGWHDDRNSRRSGNVAFDEYRRETLRRLEEEQKEFEEYLDRLRAAKDKSEFDQFMSERRNGPAPA